MFFLVLKFLISGGVVVLVSEIAKRSGPLGGLIGSIPILSMMSFIWLYVETRNTQQISALSYSIALFIIPSMAMFLLLPVLLKRGYPFVGSLITASFATMTAYAGFAFLLNKLFGIKL